MTHLPRCSLLTLLIGTSALGFIGCDGGATSRGNSGGVTAASGGTSGGSGHGAAGNDGGAQGGAGHGTAGHSGDDAGITDASVLSDASSASADASDAAASCGCVDETVSWYPVGAMMGAPRSSLSSCALFTEGYPPGSDAQASCSIDVTDCAGGTGAGAIAQALSRPGVQAALTLAPIFFGAAANNQPILRIDVAGKFIDIGVPCPASSAHCVPIPIDVLALKSLLLTFKNEQLHKSPCTELFTRNGESCQVRRTQSTNTLMTLLRSFDHPCVSAEDCTFFTPSSDCTARCEIAVSKDEVPRMEQGVDNVDTQFCVNYAQDCGPVIIPPCAPPGALTCTNNHCVAQ